MNIQSILKTSLIIIIYLINLQSNAQTILLDNFIPKFVEGCDLKEDGEWINQCQWTKEKLSQSFKIKKEFPDDEIEYVKVEVNGRIVDVHKKDGLYVFDLVPVVQTVECDMQKDFAITIETKFTGDAKIPKKITTKATLNCICSTNSKPACIESIEETMLVVQDEAQIIDLVFAAVNFNFSPSAEIGLHVMDDLGWPVTVASDILNIAPRSSENFTAQVSVPPGFAGAVNHISIIPIINGEVQECFKPAVIQITENILGCTNPEAINYDPTAIEDDGSCEFPILITGCKIVPNDPPGNTNNVYTEVLHSCPLSGIWLFTCPEDTDTNTVVTPVFDNNGEPALEGMTITFDYEIVVEASTICIENLPPGIYYLLIADEKRNFLLKCFEVSKPLEVTPVPPVWGGDPNLLYLDVTGGNPLPNYQFDIYLCDDPTDELPQPEFDENNKPTIPNMSLMEKNYIPNRIDENRFCFNLPFGTYYILVTDCNGRAKVYCANIAPDAIPPFIMNVETQMSLNCTLKKVCIQVKSGTPKHMFQPYVCPEGDFDFPEPDFQDGIPNVPGMIPFNNYTMDEVDESKPNVYYFNLPKENDYYLLGWGALGCWAWECIQIEKDSLKEDDCLDISEISVKPIDPKGLKNNAYGDVIGDHEVAKAWLFRCDGPPVDPSDIKPKFDKDCKPSIEGMDLLPKPKFVWTDKTFCIEKLIPGRYYLLVMDEKKNTEVECFEVPHPLTVVEKPSGEPTWEPTTNIYLWVYGGQPEYHFKVYTCPDDFEGIPEAEIPQGGEPFLPNMNLYEGDYGPQQTEPNRYCFNLPPGRYYILVYDDTWCRAVVHCTEIIAPPPFVMNIEEIVPFDCNNVRVYIRVKSGTPEYMFQPYICPEGGFDFPEPDFENGQPFVPGNMSPFYEYEMFQNDENLFCFTLPKQHDYYVLGWGTLGCWQWLCIDLEQEEEPECPPGFVYDPEICECTPVDSCTDNNPDYIFDKYTWVNNLVDKDNCPGETVEIIEYQLANYAFVSINIDGIISLYLENGSFYCTGSATLSCIDYYIKGDYEICVWTCSGAPQNPCAQFDWIPNDCTRIEHYNYHTNEFLYIDGVLYRSDGTVYCTDNANLFCLDVYPLQLVNSWNCADLLCVASKRKTNTNIEAKESFQFNVMPNPNEGQFKLRLPALQWSNWSVYIYSTNGQLIKHFEVKNTDNHLIEVDLGNISNGVYIIEVNDGQQSKTERLLIH